MSSKQPLRNSHHSNYGSLSTEEDAGRPKKEKAETKDSSILPNFVKENLKPIIFGGMDGIMTMFAIIAAAAGSHSDLKTVVVMGFANLLADAISMGAGEFVSSSAERDHALAERDREAWEVANAKDLEMEEMREIYRAKGLSQEDSEKLVAIISKDDKLFVDFMMVDELGLQIDEDPWGPLREGSAMFCSFVLFGFVPLIPYLPAVRSSKELSLDSADFLAPSCAFTAVALLCLGGLRALVTHSPPVRTALFMLFNGCVSGVVSYTISLYVADLLA